MLKTETTFNAALKNYLVHEIEESNSVLYYLNVSPVFSEHQAFELFP